MGTKAKNNDHNIYYNPFGPENPYPERKIIPGHTSDRYDYYSDKELKDLSMGRKALTQRGFWWDELDTEFKSKYDGTIHYPDGSRAWPDPITGAEGKQVKYPNVNSKKTENEVTKGDMWNGYPATPMT